MGVPFNEPPQEERPPSERIPFESEESETESEADSGDDTEEEFVQGQHGYPFSSDDSEDWDDPSDGGILTLVFRAAEHGDEAELQQLLPSLSVPVDTPGSDGDTALHLAALYGHTGCAKILLDAGAKADIADEDGAVPLHDAAAGGYRDLAELLLDNAVGCVNVADGDGDTPLHNAARGGFEDVIALLLQRGADPTIRNNDFQTPASLASATEGLRQHLRDEETRFLAQMEAAAAQAAEQPEESAASGS